MTRWKFAGALAILLATTASSGLVARQFGATAAAEPSETATLEQETGSAKDKPAKSEVDKFAGQMWDVLEVLSKQHLDPCPRADLIVAGVGAVRKTARSEDPGKAQTDEASGLPQEFQRRASAVNSREEFAVLLAALWPRETKVSREKLEQSFLEGVARRVGGELRVLPGPEMKIQEQISANRYVGIGIQIKKNEAEQRAQVVNAIRGGAARAAGMKADDIILKVDGKDTKDVSISGVVDWIRNEEGTKVTVEVKQPGASEARTYTMTRAVVPFESLTGFRRAPADEWDYRPNPGTPVAYLHVGSLRTSTLQELRQLEPKLRGQGFRALVLDLRNSSGDGLVRNSALLADGLLDGGLMWSTRGVDEKSRHEYRADRECMFRDWPLAVLVDETLDRQHALVAAALQDNGRAVVVGEPTKTDGYVNQVVTLPDGKTGLIFRSGILERAAKEKGWPVKPDHVVAFGPKAREALVEWRHKQEIAEGPTNDKAPDDPQLARAVEVVRDALRKAPATAKP